MFEVFKEAKQAPALTVQQLIVLRETVESHPDLWTRCFAGAALLRCYARCRWSDVQHAESIDWDVDDNGTLVFIELRIGVRKTCRLQSKRRKFLKAVAPALGVKGNFGEPWEQLGIVDPPELPFFRKAVQVLITFPKFIFQESHSIEQTLVLGGLRMQCKSSVPNCNCFHPPHHRKRGMELSQTLIAASGLALPHRSRSNELHPTIKTL